MLNISVYGRIDAMGQNQPLTVDKKTSNRYVVRLEVRLLTKAFFEDIISSIPFHLRMILVLKR